MESNIQIFSITKYLTLWMEADFFKIYRMALSLLTLRVTVECQVNFSRKLSFTNLPFNVSFFLNFRFFNIYLHKHYYYQLCRIVRKMLFDFIYDLFKSKHLCNLFSRFECKHEYRTTSIK